MENSSLIVQEMLEIPQSNIQELNIQMKALKEELENVQKSKNFYESEYNVFKSKYFIELEKKHMLECFIFNLRNSSFMHKLLFVFGHNDITMNLTSYEKTII